MNQSQNSSTHQYLPSIELIFEPFDASPADVDTDDEEKEDAQALYETALELLERGDSLEAEKLLKQVLAVVEKKVGIQRATADVLVNLSIACTGQKKFAAAKLHAHRAISIFETLPGAEFDVARTLNNMAAIYTMQELYAEGEYCLRRALQVMETATAGKSVAVDHPQMLPILANYLRLLQQGGRASEASTIRSRMDKLQVLVA